MQKVFILWGILLSYLSIASADSGSGDCIKVLVVGAGPSGLSIVKAFQNRGIYPDIIEKEDKVSSDGAGIAIPANGSWALNKLGIDISSKALLIQNMQFTDDQGEILTEASVNSIHPEGSQFYSLSRDELVKELLSHLDERIQIQTSTTIKHFLEENGQVRVEFSNGEIKSYDLVIGCDGIYSKLRRRVYPNEIPEFLGLFVWRALIEDPEGIVMPTYMLGRDRAILLYPMPNHQIYVYGHIFQSEKKPPLQSFSEVFSSFGGFVPKVLDVIHEKNLSGKNVHFYIHHMEKSHSVRFRLEGFSRVLLVGDAAHGFGPMLQNGAAQGFEDAYVLQDLLFQRIKSEDVVSLLDAFEKRRSKRVQNIFEMSNVKMRELSNPEQVLERNEAIRKSGAPNVNGFKLIMKQNP